MRVVIIMVKKITIAVIFLSIMAMVLFIPSCTSCYIGGTDIIPTDAPPLTTTPSSATTIAPYTSLEYLIREDPAEVDNSNLPITPIEHLHLTGMIPSVDIKQYSLSIEGLVKNPLVLSYEEILEYQTVTEVVLLICPGFFVDNARWTGVPLTILLAEAGLQTGASQITFYAMDSYKRTLSLETLNRESVFLAYKVNGQTLPLEHGYPLRLVVSEVFGNEWVKWINRMVIA
jgi:DMSO/TMAO reductase YedYZ molybdopterin-dependent catalytic subunit